MWETLEEATRPHLDTMDQDTLTKTYLGFMVNIKGSEEFHMIAMERLRYFTLSLGDFNKPVRDL